MNSTTIIFASFFGGMLPAFLWLEFWLKEENHHEPRYLILSAFYLGMLGTIVAGFLEKSVTLYYVEYTTIAFFLWAIIEEVIKFLAAYYSGLRSRFCDHPIDPIIYLITSALGFAAAENILFLYDALLDGGIHKGISNIIDRFVGASLLHVVATGIVGIALGLTFYKDSHIRRTAIYIGLFIAILLHTAFNRFIIEGEDNVLWVFSLTWICLIIVILVLEKIKSIKSIKRTS